MFYEEFSKLSPEEKKIVRDMIDKNYEVWERTLGIYRFNITSLSLLIKEGQDIDNEGRIFIKPDEVGCSNTRCELCGFITILAIIYDNDNEDVITVHSIWPPRHDFFVEKRGKIVPFEPTLVLIDEYKIERIPETPISIQLVSCEIKGLIVKPPPKRLIMLFIRMKEIEWEEQETENVSKVKKHLHTKCPWYKKLFGRKKCC